MKKAADEIFSGAKAAVWRDCSCCGDETSHEKSVKRLNAIAKDVMDDRGYPVAEIFDLYGKKDLDDATVDGTHATPEYYHAWTMEIMAGVEAQLKTGCLGDSYEDDEPASCPLCANQPLVWGVPTKLQNSLSQSNRSRFR